MKLKTFTTAALSFGLMASASAELKWLDSLEAGQKAAADSGKTLLVNFTGSDWCSWCIKLDDEVFSKPEFEAVNENYVLVELDFPQAEDAQTPELRAQNEAIAGDYQIEGFPTVLLLDNKGRAFARTGYREGGPQPYLAHLEELSQPWETLQKAEGDDRQEGLVGFLSTLPGMQIESSYADEMAELKKLDPSDESGLQGDLAKAKDMAQFEDGVEEGLAAGDFDKVISIADKYLADHQPEGEEKQHILMAKVMVYVEQADTDQAFTLLDEMAALAPESEIGVNLDEIKTSITEHLQMRQQMEAMANQIPTEVPTDVVEEEAPTPTEETTKPAETQ